MIVKIERYKGREEWLLLDNVVSVSRAWVERDFPPARVGDHIIKDFPDGPQKEESSEATFMRPHMVKLSCTKTDGSDMDIYFDTIAYILNDNGKTVERIVANMRELCGRIK